MSHASPKWATLHTSEPCCTLVTHAAPYSEPCCTLMSHTVSGAGNPCWQNRISTCTVSISESVDSLLITPVSGARCQQQSLLARCAQLVATEKGQWWLTNVANVLTEPNISLYRNLGSTSLLRIFLYLTYSFLINSASLSLLFIWMSKQCWQRKFIKKSIFIILVKPVLCLFLL